VPDEVTPGLLLTVRLSAPLKLADNIVSDMASVLEPEAISTSWEKTKDSWDILWLVDFKPQITPLLKKLNALGKIALTAKDVMVEPVGDVNWLEASYRQFPAFRIKSFYIHGSHFEGNIPKGLIPLQIDAATAFGSGEHGTTRGCLEALCHLKDIGFKPRHVLDMGAGSGILAIGACKLWNKPTLAIDNDREATRVACRHRKLNDIPADRLICATGDGYKARRVIQSNAFDLIIANILAQPLIDMAPALEKNLSKTGKVVLSGLLTTQAQAVLKAHTAVGLKKIKQIKHDEWSTLILQRA
jgi:ribosomal protein L11 methyltransferase